MKKVVLVISFILTALVLVDMYWWMKTTTETQGFEDALREYLSIFPELIKDGRIIKYITTIMAAIAIAGYIYLIKKRTYFIISIVSLSITGFIFVWSLFSLM